MKEPPILSQDVPMIMDFNIQHCKIEKIFKKHWPLLLAYHQLRKILPDKPKFVYRKAPTLRDIIAKNVLDPPKTSQKLSFFQRKGFYPCKTVLRMHKHKVEWTKMHELQSHKY